jgi:trans-aconitate 2-methyltransferase
VRSVLAPEAYAELLDVLGFVDQHVRLQVYGHHLASTAEVVEWLKGTSLTRFRARLDDDAYARFLERFRTRVLAEVGDRQPYFYAFKRILMWGRAPG